MKSNVGRLSDRLKIQFTANQLRLTWQQQGQPWPGEKQYKKKKTKKEKIKMATAVEAKNEKQTKERTPSAGKSKNESPRKERKNDDNNKAGKSNSCWHKFV